MNSLEIKSVRKQLNYDKKLQSYWVELKNSTETLSVPIDEGNADYIEIMRQEKEGLITIQESKNGDTNHLLQCLHLLLKVFGFGIKRIING